MNPSQKIELRNRKVDVRSLYLEPDRPWRSSIRSPVRAGTEGPDPVPTKTVFPLRAGRDRARGPNILIDPHRASGTSVRVRASR